MKLIISLKDIVSEIMITMFLMRLYDKFNLDIIDLLKIRIFNLFFWRYKFKIKIQKILKIKISAIGISNFLNFKEHAYQKIINKNKSNFRNSFYEKNNQNK